MKISGIKLVVFGNKIYVSDSTCFRTEILLCVQKKRSGDFRTAVGNLKFYKSCLCRERPWISTFSQLDVRFPFPRFPGVVWQALVWRCSWNAYGTKTGLRKFVVPFPLKGGFLIPKKNQKCWDHVQRIFQMFFQIANFFKKHQGRVVP